MLNTLVVLATCLALVSAGHGIEDLERALQQETKWTWKHKETTAVKAQDASNNARVLTYFRSGRTIYMYGKAPASGIFNIDLIPEYDGKHSGEVIALRLGVDVESYHVSRDSYIHDKWLHEENDGYSGIQPRRFFSIVIIVQEYGYEISIGGYHFTTYYHRIPYTKNMQITVSKGVYMEPIEYY